MILEILIAIFLGIVAGIVTGLIPGIHINLVSLLLLSLSAFFLHYTNVVILSVFIISMSVTHSFLDFIPSVFLGAPDADTALAILPGHKLLLQGKAFEAVKLTVIGSLGALILCCVLIFPLMHLLKFIYPFLNKNMGIILICFMGYMIFRTKKWKWNLIVFFMSGVLGLIVLNIPNLKDPLFPMLSGLFGVSMLVISLRDKVNIPRQSFFESIKVGKKVIGKSLAGATMAGFLTSMFPGLGAAQGAVLALQVLKKIGHHGFMIVVGGINTVNFIFSLGTLLMLDKARNGAVIVIRKLLGVLDFNTLLIFIAATLVVGGTATFLALKITKIFARIIVKVNYRALVICVILFIISLVIYFSGLLGLFVLIVSTFVGIIPAEKGVGRNHAMGCLILPVILYFLL